jgi:hypothetical protein
MNGQPTQVKIDEVVSRVRAIDGTHAIAPETVRTLVAAILPAVREMLDHERQVRMEGSITNGYADRLNRGSEQ